MSVTRAVNMSFVAVGFLLWMITEELYGFVLNFSAVFGPGANRGLIGVEFTLSDLMGFMTGVIVAVVMWRHEKIHTMAHEIGNELSKVTWPNWPETRGATIVVIIVTVICAILLGLYDTVWSSLTGLIYKVG
jgi:preprotein translocase subunit SecE